MVSKSFVLFPLKQVFGLLNGANGGRARGVKERLLVLVVLIRAPIMESDLNFSGSMPEYEYQASTNRAKQHSWCEKRFL